jgi:ubiquinone/menaquinone biosynthesis C-methylase UbiE
VEQNKEIEVAFFDGLDEAYNVFSDQANDKIITTVIELLQPQANAMGADLGCGSGIFSTLLRQSGVRCVGLDLSFKLLQTGRQTTAAIPFVQGDVEALPFADNSLDFVMLSCLVHHLPNVEQCAKEVFRVLKPQGRFVAFDPNRLNPFMYLYRDKSSPFYSSKGVTPNERPIIPAQVRTIFKKAGLETQTKMVSGLAYRYVASSAARMILPIYNAIDHLCFIPPFMSPFRAFAFTYGSKP